MSGTPEAAFHEALTHQGAGRLEAAETIYRSLGAWRPAWVRGNLGIILRKTGRLEEAEAVLREALASEPENPAVRHTLGMTLLQLGRWAEAWPFYEARHALYPRAVAPLPEWRGEPLEGRRLLVVGEQGLGDQILFARFLPLLAQRAAVVTAFVAPSLRRLFEDLPVEVATAQGWDEIEADVWTSIGSAPRWLGAGPGDAPTPYLKARPRDGQAGGIGLMLEGGERNPNPERIPRDEVARVIRRLASFTDLAPGASGARDFADTAALIAGLDMVVTVDTSVAHLAGALGKPCVVLMTRPASDWYGNWGDDRSPWYPTMRLIRQRTPGDWAGVIKDLIPLVDRGPADGPGLRER